MLAGQPNVGKSSLLNRLAGDDLAIVTPIAGTTRRPALDHPDRGIPLHIIDTAGLRETEDEVERIGIERSWKEIERSDVVLLLVDSRTGVTEADREILQRLPKTCNASPSTTRSTSPGASRDTTKPMVLAFRYRPKPIGASTCCARNYCVSPAGIRLKMCSSPANAICAGPRYGSGTCCCGPQRRRRRSARPGAVCRGIASGPTGTGRNYR